MITIFNLKNPVDLVFGPGAINSLSDKAKGLGKKAIIVTGRNSARKYGILEKVQNELKKAGIESIPFEKVTPNPLSTTVDEGIDMVRENNLDLVIGLGGGSSMDTAKAIALMAKNPGKITDYHPGGKYASENPRDTLPVIAITTTAGTGSEINRYLVITNDETNEKPGIGFDVTYPKVGIVDPELMLSLPKNITADTGVDVLFHALEAYVGTDANYFSDIIATEAIRLTVKYLKIAINEGNNLKARTKMAWANTLAGWAIDIAGTVSIHAAGHPLSGHYNLTHAQTLAVLGVTYLNNNYQANPQKFANLAKLLGYKNKNLTTEELASKAGEALENFLRSVNRNFKINDLVKLSDDDIDVLAKDTFNTMAGALENDPGQPTIEDIKKLYKESL